MFVLLIVKPLGLFVLALIGDSLSGSAGIAGAVDKIEALFEYFMLFYLDIDQ